MAELSSMLHDTPAASPCSWGSEGLEYDQNGPRQTLVDWIKGCDGVSTTFDFPTKGILQASKSSAPGIFDAPLPFGAPLPVRLRSDIVPGLPRCGGT